jgi:hypothetical protein
MAAEAPRVVLERLALVVSTAGNHGLIGGFTRILRPQLWGVLKIMGMILLNIVIIPGIVGWICFKISKFSIYFSIWRNIQMSSKNWKIPSAV